MGSSTLINIQHVFGRVVCIVTQYNSWNGTKLASKTHYPTKDDDTPITDQ